MVEAIEAVSITIFEHCQGITLPDGRECEFFGTKHYQAEASHSIKSPEVAESSLPALDDPQREHAKLMVDRTFALFDEWSSALLRFAIENEEPAATFARMVQQSREAWPENGVSL